MSASMNTILVLGGTSGIGEAFARRWHAQGKRVIISGRRQERLNALATELGVPTYAMDIADFAALPGHVAHLTAAYPDIDTVWINAGVMDPMSMLDPATSSDAGIQNEVNINALAPTLLARHFVPWLAAKPAATNLLVTTSGTAFVPVPVFPVYCASKAYAHAFLVALRQQLAKSTVNVIEIVPPLVNTGLGVASTQAGKFQSMSLEDFTEQIFAALDHTPAADLKEVTAGTGVARVKGWRDGIGPLLESMGVGG